MIRKKEGSKINLKRIKFNDVIYKVFDVDAVHNGDSEVDINILGAAKKLMDTFGTNDHPVYFENGVPSPVSTISVSYGGTGGNDAESARRNLEVYSILEIDSKAEEWVFTLADGTVVTKKVLLG